MMKPKQNTANRSFRKTRKDSRAMSSSKGSVVSSVSSNEAPFELLRDILVISLPYGRSVHTKSTLSSESEFCLKSVSNKIHDFVVSETCVASRFIDKTEPKILSCE